MNRFMSALVDLSNLMSDFQQLPIPTLEVFSDGNDWIVAYNPDDAMELWEDLVGDKYVEDEYGTAADWQRVPRASLIPINRHEEPTSEDVPKNGVVACKDHETWLITATAESWAEQNARGLLCSLDW